MDLAEPARAHLAPVDVMDGPATAGRGARAGARASMSDVARLARVSSQTVSRVANGSQAVSPGTRLRVQEAMEALGYSPNTAARALRSGTFQTLGVIAHRLARTGESRIVEAVVAAARDRGHTVTLLDIESTAHEDLSAAALRLSHQAIDGLIIIRAESADDARIALPAHLPVVVADAGFGGQLAMVGSDHAGGARLAVEHLLALGHRTVHHVTGPADSIPAQARLTAWREVLSGRGIAAPAPIVGDWTSPAGYAAGIQVAAMMGAPDAPTAVFCANDEMAAGFMLALAERGIRIPADVSVVGFDDIPLAGYLTTPLTTVRQPFDHMGLRLVERVMAGIERHSGGGSDAADAPAGSAPASSSAAEILPCELVVRASSGPAR